MCAWRRCGGNGVLKMMSQTMMTTAASGSNDDSYNTSGYYLWNIICPIHQRYNSQSIIFRCKSSNNHRRSHNTTHTHTFDSTQLCRFLLSRLCFRKSDILLCISAYSPASRISFSHRYRFHLQWISIGLKGIWWIGQMPDGCNLKMSVIIRIVLDCCVQSCRRSVDDWRRRRKEQMTADAYSDNFWKFPEPKYTRGSHKEFLFIIHRKLCALSHSQTWWRFFNWPEVCDCWMHALQNSAQDGNLCRDQSKHFFARDS